MKRRTYCVIWLIDLLPELRAIRRNCNSKMPPKSFEMNPGAPSTAVSETISGHGSDVGAI